MIDLTKTPTAIEVAELCNQCGDIARRLAFQRDQLLVQNEKLQKELSYERQQLLRQFAQALADAIRRPLGVVPESAESLRSYWEFLLDD